MQVDKKSINNQTSYKFAKNDNLTEEKGFGV